MTSLPDHDAVIANWWEFQRRAAGSREERKSLELGQPAEAQAADDAVRELVAVGGATAVDFLVALNDAAPADGGRAVGVGPLEDLLHEHGDSVVDAVEAHARRSPSFARALSHVWLEAGHNNAVERRLASWIGTSNTDA